jgi:hypothetical protein
MELTCGTVCAPCNVMLEVAVVKVHRERRGEQVKKGGEREQVRRGESRYDA